MTSRPRVGLTVLPFDPGPVFDQVIPQVTTEEDRSALHEFRRLMEPAVLPLVLERASREELDRLEAPLREPLPKGRQSVRAGLARDLEFHEGLWRLARNPFIWSLRGLLLRYFRDITEERLHQVTEAMMHEANGEHLGIVLALKNRNLAEASRLITANVGDYRPGHIPRVSPNA